MAFRNTSSLEQLIKPFQSAGGFQGAQMQGMPMQAPQPQAQPQQGQIPGDLGSLGMLNAMQGQNGGGIFGPSHYAEPGQSLFGQASDSMGNLAGMNQQLQAAGRDPLSSGQMLGGALGLNDYATPGAPLPNNPMAAMQGPGFTGTPQGPTQPIQGPTLPGSSSGGGSQGLLSMLGGGAGMGLLSKLFGIGG